MPWRPILLRTLPLAQPRLMRLRLPRLLLPLVLTLAFCLVSATLSAVLWAMLEML
jgi:hypothetical protein